MINSVSALDASFNPFSIGYASTFDTAPCAYLLELKVTALAPLLKMMSGIFPPRYTSGIPIDSSLTVKYVPISDRMILSSCSDTTNTSSTYNSTYW